jgi:hypothetical protein
MSHKIEIENLTDTVTIDGVDYLLLPKAQIEALLAQNLEYKKDIEVFRTMVANILAVLGLLDPATGSIKASIQSGEESYIKHILKALKNVVLDLSLGRNKNLEEKFSFIKTALPHIQKYAGK